MQLLVYFFGAVVVMEALDAVDVAQEVGGSYVGMLLV